VKKPTKVKIFKHVSEKIFRHVKKEENQKDNTESLTNAHAAVYSLLSRAVTSKRSVSITAY
jgi:hypothetical protein